jgi:hypothetical protein
VQTAPSGVRVENCQVSDAPPPARTWAHAGCEGSSRNTQWHIGAIRGWLPKRDSGNAHGVSLAMTIALFMALALQDPYAGIATPVQIPPPPPGYRLIEDGTEWPGRLIQLAPPFDYIEIEDWTSLGGGTEVMVLTRTARQPRHIWARWEHLVPVNEVRSVRTLVEADCAGWRSRTVQQSTFSRPNLEGLIETVDTLRPWSAAAPATLGEAVLAAACDE